jgi:hypothetical protein
MGKNYIPAKEADFAAWSANLIAVSKAHLAEWKLPKAPLAELETLYGEFKTLHEKCQTASYTKLDTRAKNEKKAALKKAEGIFVRNNLQNNDAMTNNGREALPRTIQIKFRAGGIARWGKPEYARGFECRWAMADAPPARIEELSRSESATRSPLEMTFEEDQRGRRLYFVTRWENGAAKKGPWSEILSAVIP